MQWEQMECPECGEPPIGIVERILGLSYIMPDGNGGFLWGDDTKMFWDESETVQNDDGAWLLVCDNDHKWYSKLLPEPQEAKNA